jgi:predicted AlkP superfamily phosphohydrolase/phosphomutase
MIGLDGATWDLLMPLAREGFLPTLRKLIENGSYGELESTIPPITAPAWASFATGKNPGKTGIFDFLRPRSSLQDLAPVTSRDIAGKTFYEILDGNGRRTIMINLPLSYPPRTEAPTITSIETQGDQFIFPSSLKDRIPELKEYRLIPDFDLKVQRGDEEYIQDIRELEQCRFRCAQKLFQWEWDFFFLLFSGIDWTQHRLYDKLISNGLGRDHPAFQLFRDVDSYLGWFLEHLPSETTLLLMSDHGFRVYKGIFRINQWLRGNNFLECHYVRKHTASYPHRFGEGMAKAMEKRDDKQSGRKIPFAAPSFLIELAQRLGFEKVCGMLADHFPSLQIQAAVDYTRTSAFCTTSEAWGVYLNLKGRFQDGIIEPEYERDLREEIIAGLTRLKNPVTGESTFDKVLDSKQIYWGEEGKSAPHILILTRDCWVIPHLSSRNKPNIFEKRTFNGHSLSGIFLAYGPGIKRGSKLDGAKIYDVAPTILHILGTTIPRDMDGRVVKEIFEQDSEFAGRPIVYAGTDESERIKLKINRLKRLL